MTERGFPYCLIVLRHGQSEWNAAGVFTGWQNALLTSRGELEAVRCPPPIDAAAASAPAGGRTVSRIDRRRLP